MTRIRRKVLVAISVYEEKKNKNRTIEEEGGYALKRNRTKANNRWIFFYNNVRVQIIRWRAKGKVMKCIRRRE